MFAHQAVNAGTSDNVLTTKSWTRGEESIASADLLCGLCNGTTGTDECVSVDSVSECRKCSV